MRLFQVGGAGREKKLETQPLKVDAKMKKQKKKSLQEPEKYTAVKVN